MDNIEVIGQQKYETKICLVRAICSIVKGLQS